MKSKRILAITLGLILTISLAGCGTTSNNNVVGDSNAIINDTDIILNTDRNLADTNTNDQLEVEPSVGDKENTEVKEEEYRGDTDINSPNNEMPPISEDIPGDANNAEEPNEEVLPTEPEADVPEENNSEYLNEKLSIKYEDFYYDAEEVNYAKSLIGMKMPILTWTGSDGKTRTNADFENGKYIIELFKVTCGYCNQSIPEVDNFRVNNSDIPVISLSTTFDDFSNFNINGEYAFAINEMTSEMNDIMEYIPWVPAFLYVENGEIQLVTYGGVTEARLNEFVNVAYNK